MQYMIKLSENSNIEIRTIIMFMNKKFKEEGEI